MTPSPRINLIHAPNISKSRSKSWKIIIYWNPFYGKYFKQQAPQHELRKKYFDAKWSENFVSHKTRVENKSVARTHKQERTKTEIKFFLEKSLFEKMSGNRAWKKWLCLIKKRVDVHTSTQGALKNCALSGTNFIVLLEHKANK